MDTLRLARADDGDALAAIYAPAITDAATSFELTPPTGAEMAERVAAQAPHAPWLVLVRAGEVAGYAYASRHRERAAYQWSIDVSVYVGAGHHRTGAARALYTSLFALLTLQGFYTAHAGIALPNAASVGLHEAMGFRPIGVYPAVGFKHGAWRDVGWWRLPLRPCEGTPVPPRAPADLHGSPMWEAALAAGLASTDLR
jgi:phosphinothricin acetyltransferase